MSGNVKQQIDPVSALIGATANFEDGAYSYLDSIEGMAIPGLVFSDLAALRVASDALRPAFEELAGTFFGPYRERGHQMLWALMKATVDIVHANHNSSARMKSDDSMAEKAGMMSDGVALKQEALAEAVEEVARRINRPIKKSKEFARDVAPGVKELLGLKKLPGKKAILTAVALILDEALNA
jgi:hypothetical protein